MPNASTTRRRFLRKIERSTSEPMDVSIDEKGIIASYEYKNVIIRLTCEIVFDVQSLQYFQALLLVSGDEQDPNDVFTEGQPILRVKEVYMALRETGEVFINRPQKNNTINYFPCSYSPNTVEKSMHWKIRDRKVFFECNGSYAFDPSCIRINCV